MSDGAERLEQRDALVRIARSVRLDGRSFALHPRFGRLPDAYVDGLQSVRIDARDGGWNQVVTVYPAAMTDGPPSRGRTVEPGTAHTHTVPMDGARPQPVRGLDRGGVLSFTLPDDVSVRPAYGSRSLRSDGWTTTSSWNRRPTSRSTR